MRPFSRGIVGFKRFDSLNPNAGDQAQAICNCLAAAVAVILLALRMAVVLIEAEVRCAATAPVVAGIDCVTVPVQRTSTRYAEPPRDLVAQSDHGVEGHLRLADQLRIGLHALALNLVLCALLALLFGLLLRCHLCGMYRCTIRAASFVRHA